MTETQGPSRGSASSDDLTGAFSYLSNNVAVFRVHLGNGPQVSDHTEHLIHLPEGNKHFVMAEAAHPNLSQTLLSRG